MIRAKRTTVNDDSASDLVSSLVSNAGTPTLRRAVPRLPKTPEKITPLPSNESHVSLGSATRPLALNTVQIERFRRSIEEEYEMLQKSEAGHCCYLNDRSRYARAHEQLEKSINGRSSTDDHPRPTFRFRDILRSTHLRGEVGLACSLFPPVRLSEESRQRAHLL